MMALPRGVRNSNPGNLRRSKDPWQGLAEHQLDREFFTFKDQVYGIRALARTLIVYQDKHGLRTIAGIIKRWAPPSENDTAAYVRAVVRSTSFPPDADLDLHDADELKPLVEAIIAHENAGYAYPDAVVDKGLVLAGVEPPVKPLTESRTVRGQQVASVGTVATATVAVASQFDDVLGHAELVRTAVAEWVPVVQSVGLRQVIIAMVVVAVALAAYGIGKTVWARIDDRRKALR